MSNPPQDRPERRSDDGRGYQPRSRGGWSNDRDRGPRRDDRGEGGYRIVQAEPFKSHLLAAARSRGVCARHDGEEFVFKQQNRFSEHYDLESSQGYVRRGEGTYASTCYPAAF